MIEDMTGNLKESSYVFESEKGVFDDRFEIVFVNTFPKKVAEVSVQKIEEEYSDLIIASNSKRIAIVSNNKKI